MRPPAPRSLLAAVVVALAGAASLLPSGARAQEAVRETQVPFDSSAAVLEVGPELRRELGLFPDVEGFEAARLFLTDDGRTVLEVSARRQGRLVRQRRELSAPELEGLRDRLATALEARSASPPVAREGRGGLVLAETVLGLGYYGWAVPKVLDVQSTRGQVAAYLLTAGASFYLPYRLTRSLAVSQAHRDAVVWGGTRGIAYGAVLGDMITLGDGGGDNDTRVILGLGMLGSLAGQILGYQAVSAAQADRGDVALWSTVGDLGLAGGFGTAVALGLYRGKETCDFDLCTVSETEATRGGHAATLALGAASLWGAYAWSKARDYTVGDARALLSFGLLGAQTVLPAAWAAFKDKDRGDQGLAGKPRGGHRRRAVAGRPGAGGALPGRQRRAPGAGRAPGRRAGRPGRHLPAGRRGAGRRDGLHVGRGRRVAAGVAPDLPRGHGERGGGNRRRGRRTPAPPASQRLPRGGPGRRKEPASPGPPGDGDVPLAPHEWPRRTSSTAAATASRSGRTLSSSLHHAHATRPSPSSTKAER